MISVSRFACDRLADPLYVKRCNKFAAPLLWASSYRDPTSINIPTVVVSLSVVWHATFTLLSVEKSSVGWIFVTAAWKSAKCGECEELNRYKRIA